MKNIDFDYVINNKNVGGKIYLCDVTRWLDIDIEKAKKVRDKLEELKRRDSEKQFTKKSSDARDDS